MSHITTAKDILDTMLGYLGFVVRIEEEPSKTGLALQVFTEESEQLIGKNGERLDDIQYLLNRLLHQRDSDAPRVRVDVQHFRSMKEDAFLEGVREQAERVRHSGRPVKLDPMNSYFRRLVHNTFVDDPEIESSSPRDSARVKRITLQKRRKGSSAE